MRNRAKDIAEAQAIANVTGAPVHYGCWTLYPETICAGADCTDPNCENCRDELYPMLPVREVAQAVTTVPRFMPKNGLTFRDLLFLWKLEDGDDGRAD